MYLNNSLLVVLLLLKSSVFGTSDLKIKDEKKRFIGFGNKMQEIAMPAAIAASQSKSKMAQKFRTNENSFNERNRNIRHQAGIIYGDGRPVGILQPYQESFKFYPIKEDYDQNPLNRMTRNSEGKLKLTKAQFETLKAAINNYKSDKKPAKMEDEVEHVLKDMGFLEKKDKKSSEKQKLEQELRDVNGLAPEGEEDDEVKVNRLKRDDEAKQTNEEEEVGNRIETDIKNSDEEARKRRENDKASQKVDVKTNNKVEDKSDPKLTEKDKPNVNTDAKLKQKDEQTKLNNNVIPNKRETKADDLKEDEKRETVLREAKIERERKIESEIQSKIRQIKEEVNRQYGGAAAERNSENYEEYDSVGEAQRKKRNTFNLLGKESDSIDPVKNTADLVPHIRKRRQLTTLNSSLLENPSQEKNLARNKTDMDQIEKILRDANVLQNDTLNWDNMKNVPDNLTELLSKYLANYDYEQSDNQTNATTEETYLNTTLSTTTTTLKNTEKTETNEKPKNTIEYMYQFIENSSKLLGIENTSYLEDYTKNQTSPPTQNVETTETITSTTNESYLTTDLRVQNADYDYPDDHVEDRFSPELYYNYWPPMRERRFYKNTKRYPPRNTFRRNRPRYSRLSRQPRFDRFMERLPYIREPISVKEPEVQSVKPEVANATFNRTARKRRMNFLHPYQGVPFVPYREENPYYDHESTELEYENFDPEKPDPGPDFNEFGPNSYKDRMSDNYDNKYLFKSKFFNPAILHNIKNVEDTSEDLVPEKSNKKFESLVPKSGASKLLQQLKVVRQRNMRNRPKYRRKRYFPNYKDYRRELNGMSDREIFGKLPISYQGELSRYKRIKRDSSTQNY